MVHRPVPTRAQRVMRERAPLRCGLAPQVKAQRGFTLIELLVVLMLVAIGTGVVSLALRDASGRKLEEEAARLIALLEGARAESRAAGMVVRWVPSSGADASPTAGNTSLAVVSAPAGSSQDIAFQFVGLPPSLRMPTHWLVPGVSAQVQGASALLLGPEAILPPQRVVLRLADQRVELASDGLAPFAVTSSTVGQQP
jgi:general secretion pathway protein H